MIEGRVLLQVTRVPSVPGGPNDIVLEMEHHGVKFKQYLPMGPTDAGDFREEDIIQFWTDPGGLRTVAAKDITVL